MAQHEHKLTKYRRMGSMEQIFTILNEHKLAGWGPAAGVSEITNLSEIPLHKIQKLWNKIHYKYESLQAQILTVKTVYEYDWIFVGSLPFNIIKVDKNTNIDKLLVKELNHRYLLLNDLNITDSDITNNKYNINKIPPLYRILIYKNYFLFNYNHAIADGMSFTLILNDFLSLLNNENTFDPTTQKYTSIEQCIDPQYAKSPLINKFINYCVPSWFAFNFNKLYCNNSFLSNYNPLQFHQDDILRTQYNYCRIYNNKELIAFPLNDYNKYDYKIDYVRFKLTKTETKNIRQQCQINGPAHMSSILQYIVNAAMIEIHSDVLPNNYYKTIVGNVFSAIPLYREPDKIPFGIHVCSYYNVVEYDKNAKIGSDRFWKMIHKISLKLLDRDKDSNRIRNIYKQKFPYLNAKKFLQYTWKDKNKFMGKIPMPSTVTNPGIFNLNKDNWRYKVIESYGSSNPMCGFGAVYLLTAGTIKGIDEMSVLFTYGTQFMSRDKAIKVTNRIKEMMQEVSMLDTTFKSKL